MGDILMKYDMSIFLYVNRQFRCNILDLTLPKLTHLGGATFTLSLLAFIIFFTNLSNRFSAITALISLTLSHLIVHFIKIKFCRKRPYDSTPNAQLLSAPLHDFSFPSGHTTAAFSVAVIFSLHVPILSFILLPLASIVAVSRVYLGLHFPSDCIVGAFIGTITSLSLYQLLVSFI
ncbi:phosphatase PAP2 family protein [Salipaludibacillus sp. HK11]|uniref:phosphatase PAP2 family protein n=1 Tax=Salipaludibacillus sp. HK11 TaxID=3394320 RepID=UPI0039FD10B6